MTFSATTLQQSIASNKFYPPCINQSQSIPRHAIISDRVPEEDRSQKIIVIEAQAGQGKTTLVHQYLEHCQKPFIWYQVGSEDNDPFLLLSALQLALSREIEDFSSPQLTAILEKGQVGPLDLQGCANILLNHIDACLKEELFIVFDDLHQVHEAPYTNQLIDYLMDTSPPRLHFILTSRHPLQLNARALRKNPHLVYIDSEALALDINDIENLYRTILKATITRTQAQEILTLTNGWVMGIVLAAHPLNREDKKLPGRSGSDRFQLLNKEKDGYILSYFEDEIFSHLPETLHDTFFKLSFLDEIDVALARVLANVEDIDLHLGRMADENFFVYRLDDENRVFRLHHLFQEFLQVSGRQKLGNETVASIFRRAALYYLENELIEKALKALCNGSDFSQMEDVLRSHGLKLVSANRTVTILEILKTIPEKILLKYSWLSFFHGLLSRDFTPQQTLPFFESCREQFARNHEEIGELMSLTQIIYFHFVISGNYVTGSKLLERTRTLFERNSNYLPDEIFIIVARNLAAGYCIFDGKMERAQHYAKLGCDLATHRDSKNFIAATRFILGYIGLLSGNRRMARSEIEKSHVLASEPLVGMSNRLTLHVMQLCELSMHGDFTVFEHQKVLIQAHTDQEVVRQTVAAPYLYLWSCIALIAQGKNDEAREIIDLGMLVSKTAASGHMTSQFLQWRAFIQAIDGNEIEALKDIEESSRLREAAGGPFYVAYHQAVKGAVLALLKKYEVATEAIDQALQIADEIPSPYARTCALAYRGYIHLMKKDTASAASCIGEWLQLMRKNDYSYFWGWEPKAMSALLCGGVTLGAEVDFARKCARDRLGIGILPGGEPIPMLFIKILGTFSVGTRDQPLFGPHDFTAHQRELFGLLISSPGQQISQDQVQLAFWPDSPPDKARKAFDTLMTRLRKTLREKLVAPVDNYLSLEKGYVQLSNISIDGVHFIHAAARALKFGKQGLWWQAGNSFASALSCWDKFIPTEYFLSDQALDFSDEIRDTLRAICLTWSNRLIELNRQEEALLMLENTERLLSADEDYILLRYQLYQQKHNPLKARDILKTYRQELLRLGYSEDEADEAVIFLTDSACP
jgi:LuxR family maltose regulon positive regulatory protein